jgi:hypothetical protein
MMMLKLATMTVFVSLGSAVAFPLAAAADADTLLPLEPRRVVVQVDSSLLNSAVQESNAYRLEKSDSDALSELIGPDVLGDLVDENGDVDLPLGITVFDAMGTTSVGFGGDF